jgi:hypothetical protein
MADTARNRLIVWGGGHNDYYGNEIYALTMSDQKLTRLNNPGPVADPAANQVALSNGTPNSRHTYGGLTYIAHADRMFVYGGDPAATFGFASNDTWTLNLATLQWQRMDPTSGGPPANAYGVVSDYDPNTRNVYLHDGQTFWQYTYETNTYKSLDSSSTITIYNAAVIDPKRKLFFIIGSGMHVINIAPGSNYSMQDWTSQTTGCGTLQSTDYPGVAYDPVQDKIVGWTGGNSVYVLDPDTKTCTTVTNPNGPGAAQPNGTHGRFRYLPGLNAFVVVNDASQNAYALKLTNSGTATDFSGRCQAPGVIRCWSFDDATATDAHVLPPNGSTVKRAGVVTDVAADGTGSLRFTIPSQSGADSGGSFWLDFADDFSQQFDQGQEFYIQYRVRYNDVILNTVYNAIGGGISGGFKMSITGEGDRPGTTAFSCTTLELPLQNIDQTGLPRAYHSCGTFQQLQVQIPNTSEFLDQNADGCPHYGNQGFAKTEPPCFMYKPFEWITIQQHVKIGHWGQPDSTVEYWAADQGQTSRLIISLSDFTLLNDNPGVAKYGKIWLLPYQTNKDDTQVTGTGQVWYDDLIISTQRIPDADVSTPNAPDMLRAATGATAGTIQLSWRDNSGATEQGFKIERCTGVANTCMANPSTFTQIATVGANTTTYTDSGLVSGGKYTYRVKAYNASGDSAYSGGACFNGGNPCYSQAAAR